MFTNILGHPMITGVAPMSMEELRCLYRKTISFDPRVLQVKVGDTIESHSILPVNVSCYHRKYWQPGQLFKVCVVDAYKTIENIGVMPIIDGKVSPNKEGANGCLWFRLGILSLCSNYSVRGLSSFQYPNRLHSFIGAPDG